MVDIRPFRAIRYTAKAGELENLITQPYDKITPQMQREYYARSPYNYCRVILPTEKNRYEAAQQRVRNWLLEGILAKDEAAAVYVYTQAFTVNGETYTRTGVVAACRLYDFSENTVFPHEVTYNMPKQDRLNMMRAVKKNLEPISFMYSDPEGKTRRVLSEAASAAPIITVQDSFGVKHTVLQVADMNVVSSLQKIMQDKTLVITDGHHRYESALKYRDEMRASTNWTWDSAFNFHMSYLVSCQEPGLVVLPTHRLLRRVTLTTEHLSRLHMFFNILPLEPSVSAIEAYLAANRGRNAFAVYTRGKAYGLTLKSHAQIAPLHTSNTSEETRKLDVVILRDVIFNHVLNTGVLNLDEDILYERWTKDAVNRVDSGDANVAFLLNPIGPETVWRIAQKHERLPEKSTDFYPKTASGLLIMDISPEEKL